MKRIFLSLGFSGRPEKEVREEINKAMEAIRKMRPDEELEFVHNYEYTGANNIECLGQAIKQLSTCDEAYFINHWSRHKGCMVEMYLCMTYDIKYDFVCV